MFFFLLIVDVVLFVKCLGDFEDLVLFLLRLFDCGFFFLMECDFEGFDIFFVVLFIMLVLLLSFFVFFKFIVEFEYLVLFL